MSLSEEMEKIKKSLTCTTYNGAQHSDIAINEPAPNATLKNVTLKYTTGDWISFDPDRGRCKMKRMSALLTADDEHKHHKACDCVTLIKNNNDLTAIYIDLKSGSPSGYSNQFKSTRQFVNYLIGLTNEFNGTNLKITKEKFVVLWGGKKSNLPKTTTYPIKKIEEGRRPDEPHRVAIVEGSTTYLNRFL